jgi:hypothetical protein
LNFFIPPSVYLLFSSHVLGCLRIGVGMYFLGQGKRGSWLLDFSHDISADLPLRYLIIPFTFSPLISLFLPLNKEYAVLTVFALEFLALGFFGVGF